MLANGFYDVPPGKLAVVVTHLEMTAPAPQRPVPLPEGVSFEKTDRPDPETYRDLFRRVGAQDWLWYSRLQMDDAALLTVLSNPDVALYVLRKDGRDEAILELDFRETDACELAFFGLTSALIGTGAGRFLMNQAISRAWARPIKRFHVHTCTHDSPAALDFYRRSGFSAVRQQIEIEDDPRLTGLMPETYGPRIPIFRR